MTLVSQLVGIGVHLEGRRHSEAASSEFLRTVYLLGRASRAGFSGDTMRRSEDTIRAL